MLLKYNVSNIKRERRLINVEKCEVKSVDNSLKVALLFTTKNEHKLKPGQHVFFSMDFTQVESYEVLKNMIGLAVEGQVFETKNDYKDYPKGFYVFRNNAFRQMTQGEIDVEHNRRRSSLSDDLIVSRDNLTPHTFQIDYNLYRRFYVANIDESDNECIIHILNKMPIPFRINEEIVIKERVGEYIFNIEGSQFINEYAFLAPIGRIFEDGEYYVKDNRFLINEDRALNGDINVYEYEEFLNISVPCGAGADYDINRDESLENLYNEKKREMIPDIIDYEKKCFMPTYKSGSTFIMCDTMVFNLFLRDRSGSDTWNTSDEKGWNQYKMNGDGSFSNTSFNNGGDLVGCLNFTDDDIYYRKKKVAKSFIRLSFYDSPDPNTQMLLYYSTIFLNVIDLYEKYIYNATDKKKKEKGIVNYETKDKWRLGLSFSVGDRYDRQRSSEGFYLYLYPDGLDDDNERTIYLKVEFNHAGYGKTVPLMFPRTNDGDVTDFGPDFPVTFNGDWKACNEMCYIPITVKYGKTLGEYIYYFPKMTDRTDNTIVFRLYEPRINNLI